MEAPSNTALVRAIRDLNASSDEETGAYLRPVLHALVDATLLAAGDGEELSAIETDEEHVFLALFTDPVELFAFEAGSKWTAVPAEEAIRRVAEGEFDGLVINPAGESFELARDDVLELFEIDEGE